MRYIIMAAGAGTRWNNYLGVPKHLIEINGETLLGRTTRLLKENGITDYIITSSDARYAQYGPTIPQTNLDCEIERFEESIVNGPVCYLYGDVYYTEDAIKTIISTETNNIQFFGSEWEIYAVKVVNLDLFFEHKHKVKQLYMQGKINRCIGWEIYRSLHNISFEEHKITNDYILIKDETDDIDYPSDYENFKKKIKNKIKNSIKNCISVIIPCYNNAENTKKLIDKLLYQKHNYYPETEIIIIENGSTEDMSFLEKYSSEDITIKHETITGASHARNVGLDMAHGEYIAFIDNDDDIADDYLNCIYPAIRKDNNKYDYCLIPSYSDNRLIVDYETIDLAHPIKRLWSVWHYCYNRRIIGNKRFDENLNVAEDIAWLKLVLPEDEIQKGILIDKPIYFYKWENNENSLSHRFNRKEITRERKDM